MRAEGNAEYDVPMSWEGSLLCGKENDDRALVLDAPSSATRCPSAPGSVDVVAELGDVR